MFWTVWLVLGMVFLGAALKWLDSVFDRKLARPRWFFVIVGFETLFLWSAVSLLSVPFAIILGGVVLGCWLAKKLDTPFFRWSAWGVLLVLAVVGYWNAVPGFWLLVLFFLALLAWGDEWLHDRSERFSWAGQWVGRYRVLLKLGVLVLTVVGFFSWLVLVGFWGFDLAYEAFERFS